ncbi:hypothetical protein HBE96_17040 [Clostridium sp. P21]|uniref:Uncharacterized protein n=1 Tax=Clostridium muellerianum TaxID=2716538 RepID=A0A7Y0EJL8_9CLOT|nr:hypothetical protein [Clostridium muellerianum]NMM64332.1 hypothetical protein [Clostridium muellerianum]
MYPYDRIRSIYLFIYFATTCGTVHHAILLSKQIVNNLFTSPGDIYDYSEFSIKCVSIVYIIRLVLQHNLFVYNLKIKIKFLGLDIEIKSKEKSAPSN